MTDEGFLDVVCTYRTQFRILAMVAVLSIILLGVSLRYVSPTSGTYVVAVVQLVTFGGVFCVTSWLMVRCARLENQ
ncbi:hypothetical protein [Halocatena halophila]|uniref:hypothetical protein n=1 Tax=Halocatena halophila TaxID=2814576 RepID=UPI002ED2545C